MLCLAFPYNQHGPAFSFQALDVLVVPLFVPGQLWLPEIYTGFWHPGKFTSVMAVPETAVDEDDFLSTWKHQIGLPWQIGAMEAVAKPQTMNETPNQHLRSSVLVADLTHDLATFVL